MTAVATRPKPFLPNGSTQLTGTRTLIRLAARRDRVILVIWLYALTASVASTAYSFRHLYPTSYERARFATGINGNASIRAVYGRVYSRSLGGMTAGRMAVVAAVGAALMGIFTVIRHTRADEEAGRLELVGATVVGRQAALAAGLAVALGACLVLGLFIAAACAALGLPASGSLALGAAVALAGCVFSAVAAVSAQIAGTARAARAIAASVLGAAYLLRAVGDSASGLSWLTWASPLGWSERLRPFAGQRWWVAGLSVAVTAACAVGAGVLATRRDLGAGLLPDRPGPARGSRWRRSPFALAWRRPRGSPLAWILGLAATGGGAGGEGCGDGGGEVSGLLEAALVQVPAAWLVAALVLALVGLVPRLAGSVGWGALGVVTFLTLFGPVLQFSHWVLDVSPFTHVPKLPGGTFTVSPLLWLAGVALALTGLGLAGLRRRALS